MRRFQETNSGLDVIDYLVYQERYQAIQASLNHLGVLVEPQVIKQMPETEFNVVAQFNPTREMRRLGWTMPQITAAFDCLNGDYVNAIKQTFDAHDLPTYVSDRILPTTVFITVNASSFQEKLTEVCTELTAQIIEALQARMNNKLIPALTLSNLGWCPYQILDEVRFETAQLQAALNTCLASNRTKEANQILNKIEALGFCIAPIKNKTTEEKIIDFRNWQAQQLTVDEVPGYRL